MYSFINLTTIRFEEHPFQKPPSSNPLAIVLQGNYSHEKYAKAIFQILTTIGLSELPHFLTYHCERVKKPTIWLNTVEKLIKLNSDLFNTRALQHRHIKLISQIDIVRHSLHELHHRQTSNEIHVRNTINEHINGYNSQKQFSFITVKNHIETLDSPEEKIIYLENQIFDYQQSPPEFIKTSLPSFDRQCEIEIERIKRFMKRTAKKPAETAKNEAAIRKLPFNGPLKVLCDIYYKMMTKKAKGGKPILSWTITQATEHICNNYCEPDGTPLSPSTVRTYLSPSKPENRPKAENEFLIDED